VADNPYAREIGRIEDDQRRIVIVGVDHGTVTLRTLRTRTSGAVTLGAMQTEELAQLIVSATWHAAWALGAAAAREAAAGGAT
jgi:imidazolonepropionase-like amidohydrolase